MQVGHHHHVLLRSLIPAMRTHVCVSRWLCASLCRVTNTTCLHCAADSKGKFDEVVEDKGVRILIDPAALMHVLGTTMDYSEDKIK